MLMRVLLNLLRRPGSGGAAPLAGSAEVSAEQDGQAWRRFSFELMQDFYVLSGQRVADNYDHYRYSHDGVDRSAQRIIPAHVAYLHEYFDHAPEFHAVYCLFQDAPSRELFRRLVLYRMLGHHHVVIRDGVNWPAIEADLRAARGYDVGPSSIEVGGMFGQISHHEGVPTADGGQIALDCWIGNVAATALRKQYYFQRGAVSIAPQVGDVVLDLGACFGDTAVYFAATVGDEGHVYAFDPLPAHNRVMALNIDQNGFGGRVTPVPCAVGDAVFHPEPDQSRGGRGGSVALPGFSMLQANPGFPVTTVDAFVEEQRVSKVDFIKMDIEGFELPALEGARETIQRFRPKLAISLYHKPLDIIDIPLWLAQNFPFYKLFLDHYTIHHEETVLYATAPAD